MPPPHPQLPPLWKRDFWRSSPGCLWGAALRHAPSAELPGRPLQGWQGLLEAGEEAWAFKGRGGKTLAPGGQGTARLLGTWVDTWGGPPLGWPGERSPSPGSSSACVWFPTRAFPSTGLCWAPGWQRGRSHSGAGGAGGSPAAGSEVGRDGSAGGMSWAGRGPCPASGHLSVSPQGAQSPVSRNAGVDRLWAREDKAGVQWRQGGKGD